MTAILGTGPGMKPGVPYKKLKSLRFWRSNVGDEGVNSICEVLRLGGAEVKISYLELLDNNITYRAGNALGSSLSFGRNVSLLTLKLDYNASFGDLGVHHLCVGLRTNVSLKQLHLQFCNITHESGPYLADVLANCKSMLEVLNLTGNKLKGAGLAALCRGLIVNTVLQKLSLADNMIDQSIDDINALSDFKDCLMQPTLGLVSVDLMYNRIGKLFSYLRGPG